MLSPGGYLDSQTTDSQYFGNDSDPTATMQPSGLVPSISGFAEPERRSLGPAEKWKLFDKLVDGPTESGGKPWVVGPVMAQMMAWSAFEASQEQNTVVKGFGQALEDLAFPEPNGVPYNALQADMTNAVHWFVRVAPHMMDAAVDSDLPRLKHCVEAVRGLLRGIDMLMESEHRIRREFTEMVAKGVEGVEVIEGNYERQLWGSGNNLDNSDEEIAIDSD